LGPFLTYNNFKPFYLFLNKKYGNWLTLNESIPFCFSCVSHAFSSTQAKLVPHTHKVSHRYQLDATSKVWKWWNFTYMLGKPWEVDHSGRVSAQLSLSLIFSNLYASHSLFHNYSTNQKQTYWTTKLLPFHHPSPLTTINKAFHYVSCISHAISLFIFFPTLIIQ